MPLEVVGAGLGRTGTTSLKQALEVLLGGPCYHMAEVFARPEHVPEWAAACAGRPVDWEALLAGYRASVDWPAAAFWRELAAANPDALVLLSTREPGVWWASASATIFPAVARTPDPGSPGFEWHAMTETMFRERFTPHWTDEAFAIAAYEMHNAAVRAETPPERLLEWRPGDGWEPLAAALSVPVPDEPFPHANTTAEFRAMAGLDEPAT